MKKGIIVYKSKYGASARYAAWLQEMTGFDCVKTSEAGADTVAGYEAVVLCGGIYASGIAGLQFLRKHAEEMRGKRTAVFCVGASPYDEEAVGAVRAHNMTGALQDIPLFYGRGMWDEDRMTFIDRKLCSLLQKSVAKKNPQTYEPWMKALMASAGQTCDWTDRGYLEPLVQYLQNK